MNIKFLTLGDYVPFYSYDTFKRLFERDGEKFYDGFDKELDSLVNDIKKRDISSDQILQFTCEKDLVGEPYWEVSAEIPERPVNGKIKGISVIGQTVNKDKLTMKTLIVLDKESWIRNKCKMDAKDLIHHVLYESTFY